jgi:hypothetical protein
MLSTSNLPYEGLIEVDTPSVRLFLDGLVLTFEFVKVAAGRLLVSKVTGKSDTDSGDIHRIHVADITNTEMNVSSWSSLAALCFQLDYFGIFAVQIEITWRTSCWG